MLLFLAFALGLSQVSIAQVGLDNRQGSKIPTNEIHLIDDAGKNVVLDSYFHQGRPVLLTLIYFGCPGPCSVVLNHFVAALKRVGASAGYGFDVVVVSIDPGEKPELARAKKEIYLKQYERLETANAWHFLTGSEGDINKLSEGLGFHYEHDSNTGVLTHPSAVFVLSQEGVLTQTLSGQDFPKKEVIASLYKASHGIVANAFIRFSEICSPYVPGPLRSMARRIYFIFASPLKDR